ncbi:SDR family oxidoreductase [Glaciihabitans sp. dw_435]|uniref:SDR family oxidoreductase n=1 Tax=Glaciihabitans sp. dw_435 TaxID=2720081 RepID=UPI001BD218A8|nr:SDR family oxidoreductase [Glaciihabitans sp. dw_435]
MPQRFENKVIVVTGGASGMGTTHARAFVAEGGKVVIADVNDEAGNALATELGDNARYHHLDVSDEAEWADFMEFTEREFGPISVMVNNAGIGGGGPLESMTFADWRKVLGINLDGVFLGTRAAIASMKKVGGGSIVNISSFAGLIGTPFSANYTTSKFAVRGLTKATAMEVADYNIRVNSVHPGYIRTPILGPLGDEVVVGKVAMKRMALPEEVSKMVLFIASDDASYSTGAEFVVDGGWAAGSPVSIGETNAQYYERP